MPKVATMYITFITFYSLLFILAILHNTPYCITKIFNISKSYLYTSILLYRGCVIRYLHTANYRKVANNRHTANYLHTIF